MIERTMKKDSRKVVVGRCSLMEINGIRQTKADIAERGLLKMVECVEVL